MTNLWQYLRNHSFRAVLIRVNEAVSGSMYFYNTSLSKIIYLEIIFSPILFGENAKCMKNFWIHLNCDLIFKPIVFGPELKFFLKAHWIDAQGVFLISTIFVPTFELIHSWVQNWKLLWKCTVCIGKERNLDVLANVFDNNIEFLK